MLTKQKQRARSWLDAHLQCESAICQGVIDGVLKDDDFDRLSAMMKPVQGLRQLRAMIRYIEKKRVRASSGVGSCTTGFTLGKPGCKSQRGRQ